MRLFLFFIAFLHSITVFSRTDISSEQLELLANQEQWHHLLHYHQAGLFSPWQSQVDDPEFFLSPEGVTNPPKELEATIRTFSTAPDSMCRFPARAHWIQKQIPSLSLPEITCPEYEEWLSKIDGESLTLIFPAAYLNSPSSMYGHTLIRIDRKHGKNPLLDYSINYAANSDPDDSEIVFSYKGLTGGYPGVFSVLPYYEKVNEYSYLEARDVWEYKLDLTSEELSQFLRHTWEIKDSHFDYYFFTENCSYHLLTILDASSERFDLADEFYASAIPADTVRAINDAGLIKESVYRPSKLNLMLHQKSYMTDAQIDAAKGIVENSTSIETAIQDYTEDEKADILELAYQYSRYLSVRKKEISKGRNEQAIQLLSARSKLPVTEDKLEYPTPETRDDQGHRSRRFEVSAGQFDNTNGNTEYAQLGLRMAYHDFLDPVPGYIKGAHLEMFQLQLRTDLSGASTTDVQKIGLLEIASYSPTNELVRPLSWRVATGFDRFAPIKDELIPYLSTGFGYSSRISNHLFYGLANIDFNLDSGLDKGYRFDLGPRLGWLYQTDRFNLNLELNQPFNLGGADFEMKMVKLGTAFNLSKAMQIRLETQYSEYEEQASAEDQYELQNTLSLMYYY